MPSRIDRRAVFPALITTMLLLATHPAAGAQSDQPTEQAITEAVEQLKADPNLASERTTRILRWVGGDDPEPPKNHPIIKILYDRFRSGTPQSVKVSKKILTNPLNRWHKLACEIGIH